MAEAAQAELRELSPGQLSRLTQLRESALAGMPLQPAQDGASSPAASAPARSERLADRRPRARAARRQWTWPRINRRHAGIALALVALALLVGALGWWWTHRRPALPPEPVSQAPAGVLHVTDAAPVLVEELPAANLPDAVAAPGLDARDQAMLADPDLELARSADLYAWYAAGHPVPPDESGAHATAAERPSSELETVDDQN